MEEETVNHNNTPPDEPKPISLDEEDEYARQAEKKRRRESVDRLYELVEERINDRMKDIPKPEKGIDIKTVGIVSAVVAFVLIFAMGYLGISNWVTKSDFETNLSNVSTAIAEQSDRINSAKASIDTAIQSIPSSTSDIVNKMTTSLSDRISSLDSQVSSIKQQIQSINGQISAFSASLNDMETYDDTALIAEIASINSQIDALISQINNNDARLDSLEATPSASNPTETVSATVKTISNVLVVTDDTTMTGSIRIEMVNNSSVAVNDIVLDVSLRTNVIAGYTSSAISGAGTVWQGYGIPWNIMEFMNTQWGLNLKANETRVIYLTYTVTGTGFLQYQTYGVPFQVDARVM